MPKAKLRVLMATGGTGGHIYPALAVAAALSSMGVECLFLGQKGGLEARILTAFPYPFYGVAAGKWDRERPDPRQALHAARGLQQALWRLRAIKPNLVMGFGGFASFPALAAAKILGVPYALHEQNAYPGKVIRWFAKGARFVATAVDTAGQLRVKTDVLGLPVREARVPKAQAREKLGLPADKTITLVMGGSQGSWVLNEQVPKAFLALTEAQREALFVLHSAGEKHAAALQERQKNVLNYRVEAYVDSVLAWSAADLAITRSGNGTLAEAAFHGVPLVMVPLPSAAENHQSYNAQAVAQAGAGVVVEEQQISALLPAWQRLLDPQSRQNMATNARALSPEGAAVRLAEKIYLLLEPSEKGTYPQHA